MVAHGSFASEVRALSVVLLRRHWQLAVAESCTGGALAAACTELPGSSAWFERGWVTYSNAAKTELLGVPAAVIARHGAVSEETVRAMVTGALHAAPVQMAVAISGIAGPGGGRVDKPVGTVWIGVGHADSPPWVRRHQFAGTRDEVREAAVRAALHLLLEYDKALI